MRKEKLEKLAALEKPPPDPLHGLRVHSWIVVLAGKREVPETFFVDALSGLAYATNDERFHGIESIWNHQNYWVNMQDCSAGCKDLMWDLLDCTGGKAVLFILSFAYCSLRLIVYICWVFLFDLGSSLLGWEYYSQ